MSSRSMTMSVTIASWQLVTLLPKGASFCQPRTPTSWLAEHSLAVPTHHDCLWVAKNSGSAIQKHMCTCLTDYSNIHETHNIAAEPASVLINKETQIYQTYMLKQPWHFTSCGNPLSKCQKKKKSKKQGIEDHYNRKETRIWNLRRVARFTSQWSQLNGKKIQTSYKNQYVYKSS